MDLHYSSLPRQPYSNSTGQAIASPLSSPQNNCHRNSSVNNSTSAVDSNANSQKQKNVAFGKQITNLQYLPYSASKSATNIYHHQLVLYQHPEPQSQTALTSSQPIQGLPRHRGVSVPNLGFLKLRQFMHIFFINSNFCVFVWLLTTKQKFARMAFHS